MDTTALARQLLAAAPVHDAFGLRVLSSGDGRARVAIATNPGLTNVVGDLHASGLLTLVDAAGLAAIIGAAESDSELDGVLPLGTVASVRFLAPARGLLVGSCVLDGAARAAVRSVLAATTDRTVLETTSVVHDESGTAVCEGTMAWSLRATRGAAAATTRWPHVVAAAHAS